MVAHLTVLVVAVGFVALGLWQLDRHQERQAGNRSGQSRLEAPPVPFSTLVEEEPESIRYRRVFAEGEFRAKDEILVRSQVHLATAGFHVVTPLVGEWGAVLVNRGWVPLDSDQASSSTAPPPEGMVTIEGWVEPSRARPPLGPEDPATGRLRVLNRVDIARVQQQVEYPLAPVYLVMIGGEGGQLPAPVAPPSFDDAGPHLGYAVQWFGFALVGLIGYFFLVRKRTQPGKARSSTTS